MRWPGRPIEADLLGYARRSADGPRAILIDENKVWGFNFGTGAFMAIVWRLWIDQLLAGSRRSS